MSPASQQLSDRAESAENPLTHHVKYRHDKLHKYLHKYLPSGHPAKRPPKDRQRPPKGPQKYLPQYPNHDPSDCADCHQGTSICTRCPQLPPTSPFSHRYSLVAPPRTRCDFGPNCLWLVRLAILTNLAHSILLSIDFLAIISLYTSITMAGTKSASGDVPKHRACDECRKYPPTDLRRLTPAVCCRVPHTVSLAGRTANDPISPHILSIGSRKLACSKEADGCTRCRREGIACYYSPQKPMGRPRKRRPADDSAEQGPASRRRPSPDMSRSGSVSSSAPSTGPEMHSFQLSSTPAPSYSDPNFAFLDQQVLDHHVGTPDLAIFDLLPSFYQDGGVSMGQSPQPACASTQPFADTLPMAQDGMSAFNDMSFLDPAFAHAHGETFEYGATPALSVGSHTPSYNSEPSYSPPPTQGTASQYPNPDDHASSAPPDSLRPIPTVACSCLSSLYMALESLSTLPNNIPAAMRITRHAAKLAHNVISCKMCLGGLYDLSQPPPMQAFQNMMLLATLVPSACNAYTAIVEMIDRECSLAKQQGRTIFFSAREIGGPWDHDAANGGVPPPDVQEFDNTDMGPHEWRRLMLAIIRLDVYGAKEKRRVDGEAGLVGLSDVIAALDARTSQRHEMVDAATAMGIDQHHHSHYMMTPRNCRPEDRSCFRILEVARLALNNLVIA